MGFFNFFKRDITEEEFQEQQKVKRGLEKTRTGFFQSIVNTLTNAQIDDDLYDRLEEQLILADVGPACAVRLVDELHDQVEEKHLKTGQEALDALRGIICQELTPRYPMELDGKPAVILVIGVNGVGKTTTIAKLASLYKKQGRRVMLAAGDTFRAAASEQLELWADRAGVPLQYFANRSDKVGGSTLGNLAMAQVSMNCVDIGLPQLAMHSCYETAGAEDTLSLIKLMQELYSSHFEETAFGTLSISK